MATFTAMFIVVILFAIAVYDTWLAHRPGGAPTISSTLREWAAQWPILPFMIGVLIGHLFWQPAQVTLVHSVSVPANGDGPAHEKTPPGDDPGGARP